MQYDLVVSDMDGTLLRSDKSISERSLRAIERFQEAGGRFTLATGRCLEATARYLQHLGIRIPLLLQNGCLLHDPVTGADLLCRELGGPALEQLWPILKQFGVDMVVYDSRKAMACAMSEIIADHERHDGIGIELRPNLAPANMGAVTKVLTIGPSDRLDEVEKAVAASGARVRMVRSYYHYLEFLPEGGGKGTGLEALLEHLGVPRSRSLAIGDGLNDLDLLAAAGRSVAMANGHPQVIEVAHSVTLSNMEDGVAEVLEALVEGRFVA